ncbi:hypothetical protein ACTWPB_07425 [Nocardia sp. IBHARD005]|uniref:hypothetical protein n=1 Tax=Nocardia sp. IBHARD005 TaxID=3457765 RepID=UPI0040583A76
MSRTFGSSWNHLAVSVEPDGRIAIEGYDRELPAFRETLSAAQAEAFALAVIDAVKEVADARRSWR